MKDRLIEGQPKKGDLSMKKIGIGLLCLLFVTMFAGIAMAQKKVLVVVSVSEEKAKNIGTYGRFFDGLEEVLKVDKITPEYFFTDVEDQPGDAGKRAYAKEIIPKIMEKKPDVIVALADVTVKYIATQIDTVPIVFGFAYGSLESMGLPKPNITGVARRSYAPDIWGLASKLFGAKNVAMLSKDSVSMAGVKKVLTSKADGLKKLSGVQFKDMYLVDTYAQWQEQAKKISSDFIYLADVSRLTKADGTQMDRGDVVKWTVANCKVPVVAATGEDVEAGALYTILTSEKEWGRQSGGLVLKYLSGTPIANLPVETVKKGALVINGKTAVQYKLDIPYDILSSAEKVIE